jgi:hypothetical protein
MSRSFTSVAVAVLTLALGATLLWACGPYFPSWLLGEDSILLEGPRARLTGELHRIAPPSPPALRAVAPPGATEGDEDGAKARLAQIAKIDRDELAQALKDLPAERSKTLLAGHATVRDAMLHHAEAVHVAAQGQWDAPATEPPADPFAGPPTGSALPALGIPQGLPGEFADYLDGAVAWYGHDLKTARAAWERLLKRPEGERHFRSTWAAFMLGRLTLRSDPDGAIRRFEQTRDLAQHGFADSLGLAASSLGWQARVELERKRFDRALALYVQQLGTGDPSAQPSIRLACRAALAAGEPALVPVAREPLARQAMTAFVVAPSWEDWTQPEADPSFEGDRDAHAWLAAVKKAGVKQVEDADRLAWAAYLGADFAAADEWLKRAPAQAPMARWIRAKLLMREGKRSAAEALLAQAAHDLPQPALGEDELAWWEWESESPMASPLRAAGEHAALRLADGQLVPALDGLLRAGYWVDSAYVAERVLTTDELRAYVDKSWPADLAARYVPKEGEDLPRGGFAPEPPEKLAFQIRWLLARRLVREGRSADADAYLPATFQPWARELEQATTAGRDAARPEAARSASLFLAACLLRSHGMQLTGTEIEPDWAMFEGEYDPQQMVESRNARRQGHLDPPTADESKRAEHSRVEPWKRFHYRYRAMDLGAEAARLLPDGSEEKAKQLATAGTWLAGRDPKAADPLFRELLRCCGETAIGQAAARLHWIPQVNACPADGSSESSGRDRSPGSAPGSR